MSDQELAEQIAARLKSSDSIRRNIDNECKIDGPYSLGRSARNLVYSISHRWTQSDVSVPIELVEIDCHDLWYMVIEAAKRIDADDAEQDRLAMMILHTRELGSLYSLTDGKIAETSKGFMWKDLPFLVEDLTEAWKSSSALTIDQRRNLVAFMARLVGVGVASEELATCAIDVFHELLERPQDLRTEDPQTVDHRTLDMISLIVLWLRYGGHKLVLQMKLPWADPLAADLTQGELNQYGQGLNTARWRLWQNSLLLLSMNRGGVVGTKAKQAAHMMYVRSTDVPSLLHERFSEESPFYHIRSRSSVGSSTRSHVPRNDTSVGSEQDTLSGAVGDSGPPVTRTGIIPSGLYKAVGLLSWRR